MRFFKLNDGAETSGSNLPTDVVISHSRASPKEEEHSAIRGIEIVHTMTSTSSSPTATPSTEDGVMIYRPPREEPPPIDAEEAWKESPFAIGKTKLTWAEDNPGCPSVCLLLCGCKPILRRREPYFTSFVCHYCGAGRLGNFVVLGKRTQTLRIPPPPGSTDEEPTRVKRPQILCMVGPYWFVTLFITLPICFGFTFWVLRTRIRDVGLPFQIVWAVLTGGTFFSLFQVACKDPGILYRHVEEPPPPHHPDAKIVSINDTFANAQDQSWRWSDQGYSYRPPGAKFDPEVQAIIRDFDHTCPWLGTAIGAYNMVWFQRFLMCAFPTLIVDVILLVRA